MKLVRNAIAGATVFAATAILPLQAYAQSCSALWFERNQIYANYGYCFKTARGQRAFGTACSTSNPRLTRADRNRVAAIRRAEKRRGC